MDKILTLFDFLKHFPSENECFDYLVKKRWSNGFFCPKCKHNQYYVIATRKLFQCKNCHHQTSVTANTVFHKSRQPLIVLFWAVYFVSTTKKSISALELKRKLGIKSYQTAWLLLHKIRKSMNDSNDIFLNSDVEVDETYIGGQYKGKTGRGSENKTLVAVALETDGSYIGKASFKQINHATKNELCNFVDSHVPKGSSVTTDGFKSYYSLKDNYDHIVNISFNDNDDKSLEKIHIIIGNLKTWLAGIFNRYPKKHIQSYLNEFVFRFNQRNNLNNIFSELLNNCIQSKTITYAELTG